MSHFLYWLFHARGSGLKKLSEDPKDFNVSELGFVFGYTPKAKRHIIKTISIKDQQRFLTCQWESSAVQKEVDEKIKLSSRSIAIKGKQMGLIGRLGLSNIRSGQKVMKAWGILSDATCPDEPKGSWSKYIGFNVDAHSAEAAQHKIKSYWFVNKLNDVYKLLDQNRIVIVGMPWYSGFNQGGGFKIPWLISVIVGWFVGGHAFILKGYDRDYQNKKVLIAQNSYSIRWGNKGDFYIDESYLVKQAIKKYGAVVNLDEEVADVPWLADAKKLYDRVKSKYVLIMRADLEGELYEFNDSGLEYVSIKVSSPSVKKLFDEWLRENDKFIGISEADFDLLSRYMRLKGLKVG